MGKAWLHAWTRRQREVYIWFFHHSVSGWIPQLWPSWSFSWRPMGHYLWSHLGHQWCKGRLPSARFQRCDLCTSRRSIRTRPGPIQRSYVYCEGNEESLLDCPHCPSHHCWHSEDASVVCHNWTLTDIKTPSNTEVIDVLLPVIVVQVGLIVILAIIAVAVKLYVIRRFRSGKKKFIVNNKHYWKHSSSPR